MFKLIKPKMLGDEDNELNLNSPEIQKAIEDAVALHTKQLNDQITSLKSNKDTIIEEKRQMQSKLNDYKAKQEELDKKDKMDRGLFEEQLGIEKNKFQETLSGYESEIEDLRKTVKSRENDLNKYRIETKLKSVISKTEGFNVQATDDATNVALGLFNSFDDKGNPVVKDDNGIVRLNKKGHNYSIDDFISEQVSSRPFWFEQKNGSGMKKGKEGTSLSMTKADFQNKMRTLKGEEKEKLKRSYHNGDIDFI